MTKESQVEFLSSKILITVGDVVTATAIRYNIIPKLSIVDFKTKRDEILPSIPNKWDRKVQVKNEAGTISVELWNSIEVAFKSKGNTLIEVDGEEDLASIPAILMAPDGAIVIYGVPDKGIAVYEVGEHLRQMVTKDIEKIRGE
ncbi:MAG: GTP-dependent dephospho-CoA kinase family protein [Thermoplasmata archaeon]